jgi:hypothetical protein
MKAIKYLSLYIFLPLSFVACKPKEQAKHSLGSSTKEYFDVKNDSRYVFTELSDTNISINYTSKNYVNNQANPDIENSEIMVYDLDGGAGQPVFTVRCESGGSEFKDRIALLANIDGQLSIASVLFNQGGNFSVTNGNGDSVFVHPTYTIKDQIFSDVIRIKLSPSHPMYREILFAKNIGLIARIEKKENRYFYLKRYKINR